VSAAGDVNGDGLSDLIIGAPKANGSGTVYVVFGKEGGFEANVSPSALDGTNGIKLTGVSSSLGGAVVGAAGDVNGDGFGDLVIGADTAAGLSGAAYVVFGFGAAQVSVAANGKSATFTDWDGDIVTIKSSKPTLDPAKFTLSPPNPLSGGSHLIYADFTEAHMGNEFTNANLTFSAKRGSTGGDGLVNIGALDASGVALGKITIDGDLQQFNAAGARGLTVYSLGQFASADATSAMLKSEITGKLGALTVKTDASRVTFAAQSYGSISALNLDGVTILASGSPNPATVSTALAIKSLTVGGSVENSRILAGYDVAGLPVNGDVQIGKVVVKGQWIASNLVAGVTAGDDGFFGTADANETVISDNNPITARIASITILGAVRGTLDDPSDGFGFSAEEIGSLNIGKAKVPLQRGVGNDTTPVLLALTGDVLVREIA
jgi:hypothetical protein